MFRKLLLIPFLIFFGFLAIAQDKVLENTNIKVLKEMEAEFNANYLETRKKIEAYARENDLLIDHILPNGKVISMVGFGPNGKPVYQQTENANAANTISTSKVYPNANVISKYNLTGRGFKVGEWDGGTNRLTHVEYQGRAIQADNGNMAQSEHATHVGGTLIAGGINGNVRGMAYQANLLANDWNNDESEMTLRAGQGLLVSNHSYGAICGWSDDGSQWNGDNSVNATYDYKFGYYDARARNWDKLAFNAPYYLIVKSAGNSRGAGPNPPDPSHPANGPYDCLPTYSVAKNILTVGAVNALTNGWTSAGSVSMSTFSSWGPTDDGRIKPDVVGCGVNVPSLGITNDNQYVTLSGTSMSGPSVAGSCLLLVEHYSNTHNSAKMRSSSLKGLVIHTADECFSFPGPDYRFGWGLMNTRKAADLISNDSILSLIKEDVLANQEVKEITVTAKGGQDLVATLCWTDYQGTPGPPAYNSKLKMLINDLDLRVINQSNQEESLPWRLNVDSVQTRARRGDNSVDNVEKIEISGVTPGQTYKIRVSHKGNLFTNATVPQIQNYSLIVSGIMAGDTNRTCRPMQTFNSTFGRFDDGSGTTKNYFSNADCKWMINTADSGNIVQFIVRGMNLIAGDTLYAYDRTTNGDNLIKKFSGNVASDTIYSTSSKMMLNFRTDGSGVSTGWEASYNSLQKPRFDFTAASQNVCIGSPVALTVQAFTPTANWVYNWTVSAGGVVSNPSIANPTVVFSAVGNYTLTLSVSNKAGVTVVTKTNLITVRPAVSPNSAPDFVDFENTTFPNFPGTPEKNWFITPDVNTWTRNTLAPFQGLAAIRIRNNTSLSNIRELVSPGIDLSTIPLSSRNLSYRVAFARRVSATSTDQLRVLASVDCGQNWTPLITRNNTSNPTLATVTGFVISDFIPEPTDYRKDSVSLSALTNGITNLLLKFEMRSDKGNNLFLDNVRIGNLALTSNFDIENEANKLDVNVFPNPSNGTSTFSIRNPKAGKVEIELLDVLGRKISEKGLMDAQSDFSIQSNEVFGSVEKGIYFIKLRTSTEEKIVRWVVK